MADFDVFLSHNSKDKPLVRELAKALRGRGLRVWLDETELLPGRPWQEGIEAGIENSKTVVVCIGAEGLGQWEMPEMRVAVQRHVEEQLPVIPVLLAGAPDKPELPAFLKLLTWVDLRGGVGGHGFERLMRGIEGLPLDGPESERKPRRRRWAWRCTPETEAALIPSVLAVVETVAAMLAYAWLVVRFDSYLHLAVSACVAPLLLLRTAQSTELGLQWLAAAARADAGAKGDTERLTSRIHFFIETWIPLPILFPISIILVSIAFIQLALWFEPLLLLMPWILLGIYVNSESDPPDALRPVHWLLRLPLPLVLVIGQALLGAYLVVGTIALRCIATLVSAVVDPMEAARSLLRNWHRTSICLDGGRKPELVPGVDGMHTLSDLQFDSLLLSLRNWKFETIGDFRLPAPFVYLPFSIGWLIAWLYRFSIKGTSTIWMPLIWAVNPAHGDEVGPRGVLHDIRYGLISQLARGYSVFVFGVAAFKVLLFLNWPTWKSWWLQYAPELIHKVLAPTSLPAWQVAALINTIGLWVLSFWADRAVRHPTLYKEATIDKVLRSTLTIRRLLTLFTTVSVLWILIQVAELGRVLGERVKWFGG